MFAVGIRAQARRWRACSGIGERVAAIAPFDTHGALREGEALDAPDDRVGHAAITITRIVIARRHGGCTAGWRAGAAPRAFPADDTGSSPHAHRLASRCRRAGAAGR